MDRDVFVNQIGCLGEDRLDTRIELGFVADLVLTNSSLLPKRRLISVELVDSRDSMPSRQELEPEKNAFVLAVIFFD